MKLLTNCFTALMLLVATAALGQNDIKLNEFKEEMLIVRTFEVVGGAFYSSKLSISDGSGEIWSTDLKNTRPKTTDDNLTTIVKVLTLVKKQGYRLVHTNSGSVVDGVLLSNYIFEKTSDNRAVPKE